MASGYWDGDGGGGGAIYVPISTEGSGTPTTRPKTGSPLGSWGVSLVTSVVVLFINKLIQNSLVVLF